VGSSTSRIREETIERAGLKDAIRIQTTGKSAITLVRTRVVCRSTELAGERWRWPPVRRRPGGVADTARSAGTAGVETSMGAVTSCVLIGE